MTNFIEITSSDIALLAEIIVLPAAAITAVILDMLAASRRQRVLQRHSRAGRAFPVIQLGSLPSEIAGE